jgi:hypothetical protein
MITKARGFRKYPKLEKELGNEWRKNKSSIQVKVYDQ